MKISLTFLFCGLFIFMQAQNPKYNNKIGEVKTLNVYGKSNIVIGKIVINQSVNKQLFLKQLTQEKDTSGIYTTTIVLDTPEDPRVVGYDLRLEFDKPVISVSAHNGNLDGGAIMHGLDSTKKKWSEKATELNISKIFGGYTIFIKSKSPIKTTIFGIAGKLEG